MCEQTSQTLFRNNCSCDFPEVTKNLDKKAWSQFKESLKVVGVLTAQDTADVGPALAMPCLDKLDDVGKLSISFCWRYFGKMWLRCSHFSLQAV
jgi:hypothetical protein